MVDRTHVPGQLYGYTLQIRHMLFELIDLDLAKTVSIEAIDDIATTDSKGNISAQQLKSAQSHNNPTTDRSDVFWKSIYNWQLYIQKGDITVGTSAFQFVVVTPRDFSIGKIADSFDKAQTKTDALTALEEAQRQLWGEKNELRASVPDSYGKYLEVLFDEKSQDVVSDIICAMRVYIYTANYNESLYKKFCSQLIPSEYAKDLFVHMLGWVSNEIDKAIRLGNPSFITCREFRDALQAQVRNRNCKEILSSVTTDPSEFEAQKEVEKCDTYIKQLDLIELDNPAKFSAASDYLRACAERTEWAARGIIVDQNIDDYHKTLIRMWDNHSKKLSLSPFNDSKSIIGQKVYYDCQESARTERLQGKDVPEFFGSGSLHGLANHPKINPRIGWHPDYLIHLQKKESE